MIVVDKVDKTHLYESILFTLFTLITQNLVKNCSWKLFIFVRVLFTSLYIDQTKINLKTVPEIYSYLKGFSSILFTLITKQSVKSVPKIFWYFTWFCSLCSYWSHQYFVKNCFRNLLILERVLFILFTMITKQLAMSVPKKAFDNANAYVYYGYFYFIRNRLSWKLIQKAFDVCKGFVHFVHIDHTII